MPECKARLRGRECENVYGVCRYCGAAEPLKDRLEDADYYIGTTDLKYTVFKAGQEWECLCGCGKQIIVEDKYRYETPDGEVFYYNQPLTYPEALALLTHFDPFRCDGMLMYPFDPSLG